VKKITVLVTLIIVVFVCSDLCAKEFIVQKGETLFFDVVDYRVTVDASSHHGPVCGNYNIYSKGVYIKSASIHLKKPGKITLVIKNKDMASVKTTSFEMNCNDASGIKIRMLEY